MIVKWRSGCWKDTILFITDLPFTKLKCEQDSLFPDVECEMETSLSLEQLIDIAKEVEDGHVIVETLNTKEKYTGVR